MRIIARSTLQIYWEKHPDSEEPLKAWFKVANGANWKNPQDVKDCYRNASILKDGRVVFNIAGNKHRLIASINYPTGVLFIKFIGTHKEYDKINAETVEHKKPESKDTKKEKKK